MESVAKYRGIVSVNSRQAALEKCALHQLQARRTFSERFLFAGLASFPRKSLETVGRSGWHGLCSSLGRINGDPKNSYAGPTVDLPDKGVLLA
ncbi:hypothetical protein BCF11_2294 [Collimonas sp. PA-H2]|nr:hypothetical protein BCF11_2294 [Collimonas sp. PA-H2]